MTDQTGMKTGGRAPKKYEGTYHAIVTSTSDPKGLMRVQVRVYDSFDNVPDADLPFAEYLLPIGFRPNDGCFTPADVDDIVIVDFPYNGDSRRPRIIGAAHFCPDGNPNMPHEAWNGPDSYQHKRSDRQVMPEPAEYHKNCVYAQHGILIEIIDVEKGAVRMTQKATGSAVEIDREGNVTAHSEKDLYGSAKVNCIVTAGQWLKAQAPRIDLNPKVDVH